MNSTRATVSFDAKDIASAVHHCDHDGDDASYRVTYNPITAYISGTPADLFAAAARLAELATAQMTKGKGETWDTEAAASTAE